MMRDDNPFPIKAGKTLAMERARDEFLQRHPDATIVSFRDGEMIVEKPVRAVQRRAINNQSQERP